MARDGEIISEDLLGPEVVSASCSICACLVIAATLRRPSGVSQSLDDKYS